MVALLQRSLGDVVSSRAAVLQRSVGAEGGVLGRGVDGEEEEEEKKVNLEKPSLGLRVVLIL